MAIHNLESSKRDTLRLNLTWANWPWGLLLLQLTDLSVSLRLPANTRVF